MLPDLVDARFPTKSAAAGNRPETLCGVQFQRHAVGKINNHSVITVCRKLRDLIAIMHDRFGNEKTCSELFVVSRCAHRRCQSFVPNSNFERLFDRQIVPQIFERAVLLSADDSPGTDAGHFFHQ
jgi:hypothetical protein